MYKRILVPFDGSPASTQGLKEALRLAKASGATLRVIYVVNEFVLDPGYSSGGYCESFIEAFRATGAQVLAQAEALARAASVECQVELKETIGGNVPELILQAAREWHPDLIVMGTHGRRGMKRAMLGSDAEMVLRGAPVPVLLVRGEAQVAA